MDVGKVDLDVTYVCNDYTRILQVYVPSRSLESVDTKLDLTSDLCRCDAQSQGRTMTRGSCVREEEKES
jgi:hypothetical protein